MGDASCTTPLTVCNIQLIHLSKESLHFRVAKEKLTELAVDDDARKHTSASHCTSSSSSQPSTSQQRATMQCSTTPRGEFSLCVVEGNKRRWRRCKPQNECRKGGLRCGLERQTSETSSSSLSSLPVRSSVCGGGDVLCLPRLTVSIILVACPSVLRR